MQSMSEHGATKRHSFILEAVRLPPCPKCGAASGDPCRTPGWRARKPHAERDPDYMPLWALYLLGREVFNLIEEIDEDHNGRERRTLPGSRGIVVAVFPEDDAPGNAPIDVVFYNGAWIRLTREEINDPEQYRLGNQIPKDEWPRDEPEAGA